MILTDMSSAVAWYWTRCEWGGGGVAILLVVGGPTLLMEVKGH